MPKSNRFPGKTHYFYLHDDTPPFFRDNAGQLSVDDEVIHLHWGKRYLDLYTGHVLRDGHGREIARILLLQDSTATAHRHRNTVIRLTILTTGLGLATALLLWFGFNRILGQILSLNQELEQTRKNLEERVKERTSTLLELNQELEDKVLELDQAQEVVRQGMLDWQRTFDAIKDVITILDADKIVVRANQAAESLLGRSPEELVGLSCREVYDSPAACAECHRDRIGKACETSEIEFRHPPTGRWFHVSVNPFCEDGEVMGYVHVTRDVTRRKLLEQHLARSRRMESIATLAGGIAHDFNNILGAILGNADLILYRMSMRNAGADATAHPSPAPEEIREYLDAIRAAGLRARDLVAQVLAFGRRTDTPRLDIDITPTVKEGIKLLRSSLPPKIELRADIQPLKRRIRANPTEVHQMLTNLCSNAVRAMGDQGLLEISLREMEISGKEKPQVPDLRPGCHIRLTVRDSGPGLSPEVRERLFDPFFTTRDVGEGSGLGLSVVYGIMQDYGGAVAVRSEPGEPTEFSLYFPCSVENEDKGSPANMLLNVPGGTERILIVDDEEDLVTMQVRILNYLGYDVVSALSGNEALEICRQDDTGFDLLFTDLFMPDMPGPQLAREVKALYPEIRIILASGRADAVSEEERRASGIDLVVRKPLDISAMAQALRSVLDREGRDGKAS